MIIKAYKHVILFSFGMLSLSACTTAKLEARLEANPQCKEVINAKTGALMPCPGTDRAFYRAAGLEPSKPSSSNTPLVESNSNLTLSATGTATDSNTVKANTTQASDKQDVVRPKNDCKPTIHNKTGGMIPCPPPD
jgi:hypothetical protein